MALGLRKGDVVQVMTGEYKGKNGKILKVLKEKEKLIVEGINMVKRHTKPNQKNQNGGIIEKEAAIQDRFCVPKVENRHVSVYRYSKTVKE